MGFWDILLIGIGLSMDAVAVSVSDALAYPCMGRGRRLAIPAAFGLFQGLMPVLGFFAGSLFADLINRYAGIVTLIILAGIGLNMIREGLSGDPERPCEEKKLTFFALLGSGRRHQHRCLRGGGELLRRGSKHLFRRTGHCGDHLLLQSAGAGGRQSFWRSAGGAGPNFSAARY